jgi:predicted naringenin-chalcone synthase
MKRNANGLQTPMAAARTALAESPVDPHARPPVIRALATAVPPIRYGQMEIFDYLSGRLANISPHARAIFQKAGVEFRHTAVDKSYYAVDRTTGERNERYLVEALPLGEAAVRRCLDAAGCAPEAVDDFFVVSCTGYEIPGLDLRLAGRMGMRPDLRRTCVLGMGCYGAFPALLRAREAVAQRPGRLALVLAVELCSLHLQIAGDMEDLVAAALFADGAAAAVIGGGDPSPGDRRLPPQPPRPRLVDAATHCDYQTFDHMAFHLTDHGFRMRLSSYVPEVLAANVGEFAERLLARNGLRREEVRFWGIHPGGSRILDYLQRQLSLTGDQMTHSRAVLREFGNMSSPTILFVLDDIQRRGRPAAGDHGLLMGFGPGLTMEGLLLKW